MKDSLNLIQTRIELLPLTDVGLGPDNPPPTGEAGHSSLPPPVDGVRWIGGNNGMWLGGVWNDP